MLAKVISGAIVGLEAVPVEVEVDITAQGFPAFSIVGLPDKAIEESKERVRAALKNSQVEFPPRRITVNLTPADLPKQGPAYDLPIALGIILAWGSVSADLADALVLGELSLDGSLRHTPGILPLVLMAKEQGFKRVFLPSINAPEASIVEDLDVFPTDSLSRLLYHLRGIKLVEAHPRVDIKSLFGENFQYDYDLKDIQGQEMAKEALKFAAAGGHNLLMSGPAGSGKTLLARTLPSILPRLTFPEALEVTKIYSISGKLPRGEPLIKKRPFRSPHHTVSRIGLIGGGTQPAPGEISLAHRGVLFLDEFPEFPRHVLESLRQPVEDGTVTISRARASSSFPAKFILIAAQNPCPCGNFGDQKRPCTCTPGQILKYKKRVSGPILDRIDLHVGVPAVEVEKLTSPQKDTEIEDSAQVYQEVQKARDIQSERFRGTNLTCNAEMGARELKRYCPIENEKECLEALRTATIKFNLSARAYHKVLKISRTVADCEGSVRILPDHINQALQYRPKDR